MVKIELTANEAHAFVLLYSEIKESLPDTIYEPYISDIEAKIIEAKSKGK